MTKKKVDNVLDAVTQGLIASGWKKNGYQIYKYMDKDKEYISSIIIDRVYVGRGKQGNIKCEFEMIHVGVEKLSHFVWEYWKPERWNDGLFTDIKLPVSSILRGSMGCRLVRTKENIEFLDETVELIVAQCNEKATENYQRFGNFDTLISAHDVPSTWNGAAILLYLYKKYYNKVREILKSDETYPPTHGGNVKLGVWYYLEKNNL